MKIQVDDLLPICQRYYEQEGNMQGGNLHIVLDDFNVDDTHIRFCSDAAAIEGDWFGHHLAGLILILSKTQRLKLAHKLHS